MCVCVCVCVCARGWAGACAGGVRFSNSNRIIPSYYRILLLLKMPIPNILYTYLHLYLLLNKKKRRFYFVPIKKLTKTVSIEQLLYQSKYKMIRANLSI